ncbi:MAG: putative ABC exporter domain-containing protein [Acidobacteriota bacterium]
MIATFVEFTLRGTRNRIVQRLRRLRDPRYLIGAVVGLAYLWFAFFRNTRGLSARRPAFTGDLLVDILGLVVLAMMVLAWALPQDSGGLQFSEAEIAHLFPAPLRRRDLLLYKIIRAQPQALGSAIAFFIFGWRRSWLIGVWAALSVLSIYFIFVALGRARLKLMHIGFIARLVIVSVILTALANFAIKDVIKRHPIRKTATHADVMRLIDKPFRTGAVNAALFVPRFFSGAAVAPTPATLATSVAGLAGLGFLFFVLAARMNVSFEEASIVASAKRAARIERMRSRQSGKMEISVRRFGPLFRLAETGTPEVAIFWKNVIALVRTGFGIIVLMLVLAVLMIGIAVWSHEETAYTVIGSMFLFMAAFFPIAAPQMFANDLRLDLARSEVLKSYPLAGDKLVAAEMAAPLFAIGALNALFAVCGSVLIRLGEHSGRLAQFAGTPQFVVTVLILTLPVCAVLLLIRNAMPLYFPAWTMRPADDPRSFVTIGNRIVVLFANLIALAIALIPAALVFLPSLWIAVKFFSGNAIFVAVATVPAAAVIVFEVWLGVKALGARFDALDVSNEFDIVMV